MFVSAPYRFGRFRLRAGVVFLMLAGGESCVRHRTLAERRKIREEIPCTRRFRLKHFATD